VGVKFYLYNNVGSPIEVQGCGRDKTILDGAQEKIRVCDELAIIIDGQTLRYFDFIPMPNEDHEFEPYFGYGVGKMVLHGQINRDGRIFIVKEDAHVPVSVFDHQPASFPIAGEQ